MLTVTWLSSTGGQSFGESGGIVLISSLSRSHVLIISQAHSKYVACSGVNLLLSPLSDSQNGVVRIANSQ